MSESSSTVAVTLVLVAHGTRDPAGAQVAVAVADGVRARLPGTRVEVAFADVRAPDLTTVLREVDEPAVVVPMFLASGYHVTVDLPAQILASGRDAVRTPAFGPAPTLVAAARDRLRAAGWRTGDPVVLAAAGSSDPLARAEVAAAARRLGVLVGAPVRVGYAATATPRVDTVVSELDGRVAVASWLLAPGLFHRTVAASGAAVVADPLGAHPSVVDLAVRRYLAANGDRVFRESRRVSR